jgi:hypothetical protein
MKLALLALEILVGVLKFPSMILRVVRVFQATPEAHHEAIIKSLEDEAATFKITGRGKWD